jgi:hypothetical protein
MISAVSYAFVVTSLPAGYHIATFPQLDTHKVKVILRQTVSRPACFGGMRPFVAHDHVYIAVRHLRVCWIGAPCLKRGQVCSLQLLPGLPNAVTLWSQPHGTQNHTLLSQIQDSSAGDSRSPCLYPPGTGFSFRRLLRLAAPSVPLDTQSQKLSYYRRSVGKYQGTRATSETRDQLFFLIHGNYLLTLAGFYYGAPSPTRGWVCNLKVLLGLQCSLSRCWVPRDSWPYFLSEFWIFPTWEG